MAIELTAKILDELKHPDFEVFRKNANAYGRKNNVAAATVQLERLSIDALKELGHYAEQAKSRALSRALKVFMAAREGDFTHSIPKFEQAGSLIFKYLSEDVTDGWIYVTDRDGHVTPELVVNIDYHTNHNTREVSLVITTRSVGKSEKDGRRPVDVIYGRHVFTPDDVTNKTVIEVLQNARIQKETAELRAAYDVMIMRHFEEIVPAFAKQFRYTGKLKAQYGRDTEVARHKVIVDLEQKDYAPVANYGLAFLRDCEFDNIDRNALETGLIPYGPFVRVFNLHTYDYYWVHSSGLTPYVYNKDLGEKLVLPDSHRDLLDVMTTSLTSFVGDIVEGKSTGNVILCTGIPGIGKTLTAEVYAEIRELPLYSIHSGNLGTTAEAIEKNLSTIFKRAKRWGCILLLDEADVFVMERGSSIQNNAIVAEFLRTMEYFDGLLFMTTNRHSDIDDAILSRCLAIIRFEAPKTNDAKRIWKILSKQLGHELSDELISELVELFPTATGRDMKLLCGQVFRMWQGGKWQIDAEGFRKAGMFRGMDMAVKREVAV